MTDQQKEGAHEFEGKIESLQAKESQKGNEFYAVKVDGARYSAWDVAAEMISKIPVGKIVKGTYDVQGKYKNIRTVQAIEKRTKPVTSVGSGADRDEYWQKKLELDTRQHEEIRREWAAGKAVETITKLMEIKFLNTIDDKKSFAEEVIRMANFFDTYARGNLQDVKVNTTRDEHPETTHEMIDE